MCVQALIEYTVNDNLCGGTLVRPDWVVTAAHCLYSSKYVRIRPADLIVRMGVHNRSATEHHQQLLQVRDTSETAIKGNFKATRRIHKFIV